MRELYFRQWLPTSLHYKVPFGILGRMIDRMIVNREVNTIFAYRKKVLAERFGT